MASCGTHSSPLTAASCAARTSLTRRPRRRCHTPRCPAALPLTNSGSPSAHAHQSYMFSISSLQFTLHTRSRTIYMCYSAHEHTNIRVRVRTPCINSQLVARLLSVLPILREKIPVRKVSAVTAPQLSCSKRMRSSSIFRCTM